MVDLSAITRPVGRLVATAQNGLEVLRYGGLETGAVPSPFQIIESVPMYRLRRYFPPDTRPGAEAARTAGADGAPDDDVGRHVGRHPRRRRGRHPAQGRASTRGSSTSAHPTRSRAACDRNLADHVVALSEAIDTVKEVTGRDVHLAGYSQGGMFAYQTAAYRRSKDLASIIAFGAPVDTLAALADEPARQPRRRRRGLHGRPRVQPHRHPGLAGAHRFPDARPDQDRAVAAGLPAPAARPRGAAAPRAAAAVPGLRGLDRLVRARRSPNCSSSSSRTTG